MTPTERPAAARFVEWAWSTDLAAIPQAVLDAALLQILDSLGDAAAACRYAKGSPATEVALAFPSPAESTVIGAGRRVPAPWAALANGARMHALDFDGTHADALIHPSSVVLPAALAVGEATDAPGPAVLAAYVTGVETALRLGAAVRNGFHGRGFHATSVCGVFGAALAAARLGGLEPDVALHALGIAGSQAGGSLEFLTQGTETKVLHPGLAAMGGLVAARLAAAGAEGPATILEGEFGLFRAYANRTVTADDLTAGLGERWETPAVALKLYPACHLSHASLDALGALRAEIGDPGEVSRIAFDVPADAVPIVCEPAADKVRPRTPYDAKFSLAWCAALLLVDGHISLASFDPDRLDRPEIAAVADRVVCRSVDSSLAAAASPGVVTATLADGRVLHATAEPGAEAGAVVADAVRAKFEANVADPVRAAQIAAAVDALSRHEGIDALAGAMGAAFSAATPGP